MEQLDPENTERTGSTERTGNATDARRTAPGPPGSPLPRSREDPVLEVSPWWDPALAVDGHSPLEQYAEQYWLPILGPAALLALRYGARGFRSHPGGFRVTHSDFARSLGLGNRRGANAPAVRCLDRLAYFGHARIDDTGPECTRIQMRTHVPDLPGHLWRRLPKGLRPQDPSGQETRN